MKGHMAKIGILLGMIVFTSCSPQNNAHKTPDGVPTIFPTYSSTIERIHSTETMTPVSKTTVSSTRFLLLTATQTPPEGFSDLPDGDYIIYESGKFLSIISLDGKVQRNLLDIENFAVDLSPDHRYAVLIPDSNGIDRFLLDLNTFERTKLPFLKGCIHAVPSSDLKYIIGSCSFKDYFRELYLFSMDGELTYQLTNCQGQDGNCGVTAFSPDGKWISYMWEPAGAIQSARIGFYLMPSSCLATPDICEKSAIGPLQVANDYVWAPNSKYLASSGQEMISVFELSGQTIERLRDIQGTPARFLDHFLVWSPNSDQIAYTTGTEIYLINASGGVPIQVKKFDRDVYILGWEKLVDGVLDNKGH